MTCSEHFRASPLAFPHLFSALMLPLMPQVLLAVLPTTWLLYSSCCLQCSSTTFPVNVFSPWGSAHHTTPPSLLGMLPLTGPLAPDLWCGRDPGLPTSMFPLLPLNRSGFSSSMQLVRKLHFPDSLVATTCGSGPPWLSSPTLSAQLCSPGSWPGRAASASVFTLWLWAGFGQWGALAGDWQKR